MLLSGKCLSMFSRSLGCWCKTLIDVLFAFACPFATLGPSEPSRRSWVEEKGEKDEKDEKDEERQGHAFSTSH